MPQGISIAAFILGAVFLLIALLGGNFKLFGAEVSERKISPFLRFIALIFSIIFFIIAFNSPQPGPPLTPTVPPSMTNVQAPTPTSTPMPPAPVAAQTLAQPTVMPTNTAPTITQLPESSETSTSTPTPLSSDCKVGILCDVIPKFAVGGKVFSWSSPTDSVTSELIQTCARSGALGLEIKYALSGENDNGGWGVHWVTAPDKHLAVSHLGYLTFWVKGSLGNETFQIGLKDTTGTEVKIQSDEFTSSIPEWTLITIPLSRFKDVNTASVENVSFSVTRQHKAGNICIDDIGFQSTVMPANTAPTITQLPESSETPASSPPPLSPDCKVGVLCDVIPKYAVGGTIFSWSSPPGSVTSNLNKTCAMSGALGLEMKYALPGEKDNGGWGVRWANSPDNHLDVSDKGYLTFWVKGALGNETFQIGLKDTTGTEVKIQSDEFTPSISEWTLITIPLSRFKDVKKVVKTALVENVSFSVTRQHKAGNICIDDIGFQ